jgi:hypothetical protein
MTPELLQFSRHEMIARRLVQGDRGKGEDVGQLSPQRLRDQKDVLLGLRIMEQPVEIPAVVSTEFLPAPPK